MSPKLILQSTGPTSGSKRPKSKRPRKIKDPKVIEQKLSQKVSRSKNAVEKIADDVLLAGGNVSGGMNEAFDDMMGYDSKYAKFLLERDQKKRDRLAAIEKTRRAETAAQRQQRLMREERMEARKHVQDELYRDDRTPWEKARDIVNAIDMTKIARGLDSMGLLIKPWQCCTLICMFAIMLTTNIAVFGKSADVQVAPNSYPTFCTNCSNKYDTPRTQFEEFSFYGIHPENFKLQYNKNQPDYPACTKCNVVHQKLILVARPDRDDRFLLATNSMFKMPTNEEETQKLCDKYQ
ncbi:MAG: hypothetical protein JKX85_07010 [Phycisphaeraceae bacterium]|nr:hypothetical protein [Phycisphaeraceae bacterium]